MSQQQNYGFQPNLSNPIQPGGVVYNQNTIPVNNFSLNQPNNQSQQPNMITATPVVSNNQSQIQNQQQNSQSQNTYQQTYLPGRLVNSSDEIAIVEVPMNAPISIFPKSDKTEIYIKYWTEQGVQTETFVRKEPEQPSINASESDILNALNSVMERVSKLEANQTTKTTNKKTTNKEESVS